MPGVTPVQRKDSMGQMGSMFQMAKTAYDTYKGSGTADPAAGGQAGAIQGAPPPAVPTQQPDLSGQAAPDNAAGAAAMDRRMSSGSNPNKFRGGY